MPEPKIIKIKKKEERNSNIKQYVKNNLRNLPKPKIIKIRKRRENF